MRLDRMLWTCLVPGAHSFEEKGIHVVLTPNPDETVLLFQTDGAAFRENKTGVKASDLMFLYRGPVAPKPVLLFVELKGSDLDLNKAEEQLKQAIKAVIGNLADECLSATGGKREEPIDRLKRKDAALQCRAVIVFGEAAIENTKVRAKALFRDTGVIFRYHYEARSNRPTHLREYLPTG